MRRFGNRAACEAQAIEWLGWPRRSDRLDLRPLLVIEGRVRILKGRAHLLDGLQHGIEPLGSGGESRGRRDQIAGLTRRFQRLGGTGTGVLQHLQGAALGVVGMYPGLDFAARPLEGGRLRRAAALYERALREGALR